VKQLLKIEITKCEDEAVPVLSRRKQLLGLRTYVESRRRLGCCVMLCVVCVVCGVARDAV